MKKYLVILMTTIAVISLSCGIRSAFYGQEAGSNDLKKSILPVLGGLASNNDYFGQNPLPTDPVETIPEPGMQKDNEDGSANEIPDPLPPSIVPSEGDFDIVDVNDVRVTRKNGMQVTRFPSGEVYYVPAEI